MTKKRKKVNVSLFRFDCKTDYLPYYKSYLLYFKDIDSIYDILNMIYKIDEFEYNNIELCFVKVNGLYMNANTLVLDIISQDDTLIIEPISTYRVTKDLVIDTQDYIQKLNILDKYLTDEEKDLYKFQYILEYYASNTINFNANYIGDHILMIAYELIKEKPEFKNELLKILQDSNNGIWYHTSLYKRLYIRTNIVEAIYYELINMIEESLFTENNSMPSNIIFSDDIQIKQSFKNFNIAVYKCGDTQFKSLIIKSDATYIKLESQHNDLALNSQKINKDFSLKIAGEILLEAKDNNADFLIVNDKKMLNIFDGMQLQIAKIVGRNINVPIITKEQFIMLLDKEKDINKLGFNKHQIKVDFFDYTKERNYKWKILKNVS